jgi:para-nitrobenzyl esterase
MNEPVVTTGGPVAGLSIGEGENAVRLYRGIPYAASTAGPNRWRPPQPVVPWEDARDATRYPPAAPQEPPGFPYPQDERSEDCLTVNIVTSAGSAADRLPVMVWFHGGGYFAGSANNDFYNSVALARHGVVLVTVNHRLNLFGLLAHPLLSKESPHGVSGNYLFLDLIASLEWVRDNIAAFGGDPGNVTIFGESGGGGKVSILLASPLAKGFFHRAICESGTAVASQMSPSADLEDLEEKGERLFDKLGVAGAPDPLAAARAVPWPDVFKADLALAEEMGIGERERIRMWTPNTDGWLLPKDPADLFREGRHNAVPTICGANAGEMYAPPIAMPHVITSYCFQQDANNKAGGASWMYLFNRVPPGWREGGVPSVHTVELHYLFGLPEEDWEHIMPGPPKPKADLEAADARVAEGMRRAWTQFARTGDPSVPGIVEWPRWDAAADRYLYIADPFEVRTGFSRIDEQIARHLCE